YDQGNTLLGSTTVQADENGEFIGATSATPIAYVAVSSVDGPFVDNVSFEVPIAADLTTTLSGAENPPGTMTFTLTVANQGPSDTTGVTATLSIPSALSYVSDDCSGSGASSPWSWTVGSLAKAQQETCHVVTSVVTPQGFVAQSNAQSA